MLNPSFLTVNRKIAIIPIFCLFAFCLLYGHLKRFDPYSYGMHLKQQSPQLPNLHPLYIADVPQDSCFCLLQWITPVGMVAVFVFLQLNFIPQPFNGASVVWLMIFIMYCSWSVVEINCVLSLKDACKPTTSHITWSVSSLTE